MYTFQKFPFGWLAICVNIMWLIRRCVAEKHKISTSNEKKLKPTHSFRENSNGIGNCKLKTNKVCPHQELPDKPWAWTLLLNKTIMGYSHEENEEILNTPTIQIFPYRFYWCEFSLLWGLSLWAKLMSSEIDKACQQETGRCVCFVNDRKLAEDTDLTVTVVLRIRTWL